MSILIANAPVSWGIYEFEGMDQKFTYQQVLDQIAETGYRGLEYGPWGFLPSDPQTLRDELDTRNLQLLSSYVPVKLADESKHSEAEAHALKVGRVLAACDAIYMVLADDNGAVPELVAQAGRVSGSRLSSDEWDVVARGVNRIARKIFDETGLPTVFHHHCAGYVETPEETKNLMDRTDPDLVGLCLDTGHWHYGGGDALDCVKTYGERVRYLHLKDCDEAIRQQCIADEVGYHDAVARGVFCELGDGAIDFPAIIAEMEKLGYQGWAIVEQDILTDDLDAPRQSAARNRDYLRGLGL